MTAAISVNDLKVAGSDNFSLVIDHLDIQPGERVGIVGPNGSGKTTLIESILGSRRQESGHTRIFGLNISDRRAKRQIKSRIGVQLQDVQLPRLTRVSELIKIHKVIYGVHDKAIYELLGIKEINRQLIKDLSRGQNQRLQLFLALAHTPELVMLDEPTTGLDESFASALRNFWSSESSAKTSLLLISHIPTDLTFVDRLICLKGGRVLNDGKRVEMVSRYAGSYRATIRGTIPEELKVELLSLPGVIQDYAKFNTIDSKPQIVIYGRDGFAEAFRTFIDSHALDEFSLEPCDESDFLLKISRGLI